MSCDAWLVISPAFISVPPQPYKVPNPQTSTACHLFLPDPKDRDDSLLIHPPQPRLYMKEAADESGAERGCHGSFLTHRQPLQAVSPSPPSPGLPPSVVKAESVARARQKK